VTPEGNGGDALRAADLWFARNGLTYFVPEQRVAVRAALAPRRLGTWLGGALLALMAVGTTIGIVSGQGGFGPAIVLTGLGLAALTYGLTALRMRHILGWALARTFRSLTRLLPMVSRALPLLLLFVTFLFINAEVWQMAAEMPVSALWLTVVLFVGTAMAFLLVRLPEEVDKVDDHVDAAFLRRACRGTPLAGPCEELVEGRDEGGPDPVAYATIAGFERWNLVLALLVIQAVQVLLMAVAVFGFFLVFGSLVMTADVQLAWTGLEAMRSVSWIPSVSAELVRVSLFLAAFSLLYLTVSTVTDETYREQFFGTVLREMERAVGMRAVYLALRARG